MIWLLASVCSVAATLSALDALDNLERERPRRAAIGFALTALYVLAAASAVASLPPTP